MFFYKKNLIKINFFLLVFKCEQIVVSPNTGKYGPEKTPYLDTFHAVELLLD